MECTELCPYNSDISFEFSKPINILSEKAAKSIQITKVIDEHSKVYEGIMGDHRVKVQYPEDDEFVNFLMIIEDRINQGEDILGYWYCPVEKRAVIVYGMELPAVIKLSEKIGCKYKSLDLECPDASPLSEEELDKIEIVTKRSEDLYEGRYKSRRLSIRHRDLKELSYQEKKILHETKTDTKEEVKRIRVEKFRNELCFQSKAAKINMAIGIYAYWLCDDPNGPKKGFVVQNDIRGADLRDFLLNNPNHSHLIETYLLLIYAIITQNLDLRISHNGIRRLDGSVIKSNIMIHGGKSRVPFIKFLDYSKATQCPNDISLMKTFTLNRQIHLGGRINLNTKVDLDSETLAHYFFEDIVDFHKLILIFYNTGLEEGRIKEGDLADKIRISIVANKFDKLETWVNIYRKLIRQKLPSPNEVLTEVSSRFRLPL